MFGFIFQSQRLHFSFNGNSGKHWFITRATDVYKVENYMKINIKSQLSESCTVESEWTGKNAKIVKLFFLHWNDEWEWLIICIPQPFHFISVWIRENMCAWFVHYVRFVFVRLDLSENRLLCKHQKRAMWIIE